jgi:UDP-2-acetamido-3-amino-2,3-dideoxy-glucuronate N-acetyltransferase
MLWNIEWGRYMQKHPGGAPRYIHESYVEEGTSVGEGTRIWRFCHVRTGARIGRNCTLGQNVYVGRNVNIGDGVKIQNNVSVYEGVTLEDHVFCAPSVVFTNVLNPRSQYPRDREKEYSPTLGANATVLCGVTIGRYAFVGAGAVVTHRVSDQALVCGNQARQKGWMCVCGHKLDCGIRKWGAACKRCGASYSRVRGRGLKKL